MKGYGGKNLRVNLSDLTVEIEQQSEDFYRLYLGGTGFIAATILRELPPFIDPLGPENKLVFALGPLCGHQIIGSGRHSIGGKSPLTNAIAESEAGGFWGAELRKTGFDFIIIEGTSQSPVYLWINNMTVEIRSADHLWGFETLDTQKAIRKELKDSKVRVACIGPGGERLVRYACVTHDVRHIAGRNGLGAVMGSKKLKAIAVRGNQQPEVYNGIAIKELSRSMGRNFKTSSAVWQCGTGNTMISYEASGNLPVNNFKGGLFPDVIRITPQHMMEQDYLVKMSGCYICPIKCKREIRLEQPWKVNSEYGGPEYETLAAFGSNCGNNQVEPIIKAHELCNRYGIDTISTGVAISFAMECYENGLLEDRDTDGLELRFGNVEAMLSMVEKIATKQGLGALLAEGVKRASEKIGLDSQVYAMHVKGCEMPMHDPRSKHGMGLHYSVHSNGPDHCTGIHDGLVTNNLSGWDRIDVAEPLANTEMNPRKARMLYHNGLWRQAANYLGLCLFVPWSQRQKCDAVEAVTGWPMSSWRIMKTVERGITLNRIFNLREGFSIFDDVLPKRFYTSPQKGPLKDNGIDPKAHAEAREVYFQMLGWDEDGIPKYGRLVELGIEWAEKFINRDNTKGKTFDAIKH